MLRQREHNSQQYVKENPSTSIEAPPNRKIGWNSDEIDRKFESSAKAMMDIQEISSELQHLTYTQTASAKVTATQEQLHFQ